MGSNQGASQKGMSFGGQRHIADIQCDNMSKEGQSVIGLQMGSNEGASQKGMSFGTQRHVADIHCDDLTKEDDSLTDPQMEPDHDSSEGVEDFDKPHEIKEPDM
jgi:hypothetical protein